MRGPITIRPATADDTATLVALGQTFRAGSRYASLLPDNPDQMAATVARLRDEPDGTVLVAEVDDQITGTIGLLAFIHHFSGELTVGELFFYVAPAHRGRVGVLLLRAATRWAQSIGATTLQLVAPDGEDRVERLYAALDCVPLERAWVLAL